MKETYQYIVENTTAGKIDKQVAVHLIKSLMQSETKTDDDMAIIGISARFPGADGSDAFWEIIKNGVDCITELPGARRRDLERLINYTGGGKAGLEFNKGAYLDDIDKFDYSFFKMLPKEASLMDPNQRLFLQAALHALEDGGYGGGKITGSKTGIYVGFSSDFGESYKTIIREIEPSSEGRAVPGNIKSIIASRIAYFLDLKGPSMLVDTACSSSLLAVHLACTALKNGECDMAIAGGVKILLMPFKHSENDRLGIESSIGKARTFDDSSDGTGFGEGAAAVLLKPLKKAIRDRDNIYAVIKGSSVNQDGYSIGITAPNAIAQRDLILKAWEKAGIEPDTVTYIEAHGTGTKLGDPIEIDGIESAFRKHTHKKQFCGIGSLKTNIGHLDNAAGIAGLIKLVMALKHSQIPPTINFQKPNRKIDFSNSPVYVNDCLNKWETDGFPKRCGINSFGLSGTNCHVVLEEKPLLEQKKYTRPKGHYQVLTLSAVARESLEELVAKYYQRMQKEALNLEDICYTANTGRGHFNHRLALVVRDEEDLENKLQKLMNTEIEEIKDDGIYYGQSKVVFEQREAMGLGEISKDEVRAMSLHADNIIKELLQEKGRENRSKLDEICRIYTRGGEINWEELYRDDEFRRVSLPAYPFLKKRCWIEVAQTPAAQTGAGERIKKESIHPLLDECLVETLGTAVYYSGFNTERHWVLKEHKVLGKFVPPGTTYIEMARTAGRMYLASDAIELRDVVFMAPMIVNEGETKEVHTIIKMSVDHLEFSIVSRQSGKEWITHANGRIYAAEGKASETYSIGEIKSKSVEVKITDQMKSEGSAALIEKGLRWNNLKSVYTFNNEILAYLKLPEEFAGDLNGYAVHPSLLDSAVNLALYSIGEGLYLPFSYKKFRLYGKMPDRFYSYLRGKEDIAENKEAASFDIVLLDEGGNVFAEIEGYTIKKVHQSDVKFGQTDSGSNKYFNTRWVEAQLEYRQPDLNHKNILIFSDEKGMAEELELKLKGSGAEVTIAKLGRSFGKSVDGGYIIGSSEEDYLKLLEELKNKDISHIIHLMAIAGDSGMKDMEDFRRMQDRGVYSLYYLTRALIANKLGGTIEILLVSDCASEVTKDERIINPHNQALFGLGRVVNIEYHNLRCRCVDIDDSTPAESIIMELGAQNRVYKTAYRNNKRYVEELASLEIEKIKDREFEVRENGVYVITGGTGGLGLEIARYLASKARVRLCLINRSAFPVRQDWDAIMDEETDKKTCKKISIIKEIENTGSLVSLYSADVSKEEEIGPVLEAIKGEHGRINGVVHCAGLAGDGFIIRRDEERFDRVLAPKMQGTWALNRYTAIDGPDIFVMFSSVTAVTGGPGQGDYTAANSFMDSFAAYRRRQGGRTLAINWAPWKETGMAVDYGANDIKGVFKSILTSDAVNAFEELLKKDLTTAICGEMDYEGIAATHEILDINYSDELKAVIQKNIIKAREGRSPESKALSPNLIIKGENGTSANEIEMKIAQIWSAVMGLEEININDSFTELGGDSIVATHLLRGIETEFPGLIDISDIFTYPTIKEISKYIEKKLIKKAGKKAAPKPEQQEDGTDAIEEIMSRLAKGEISDIEADELMEKYTAEIG